MSKIKNAQLRYRVIDRCLRNQYKPFPSKEDLRQACEEAIFGSTEGSDICDSTIEKDMFAMRMEFDAPIKYSKRDKGYYYEDEEYSIDKIPLSEEDIDAIKFATNTLMQFRDVGIFNQFGYALDKIFERVHVGNSPDEDVSEFIQFETVEETRGGEFLPLLLQAIKDKEVVEFDYGSFQKANSKPRKVLPLLLKEYRNRWYLISYSLDKKRITTYALDRMEEPKVAGEHHYDPINFDPKKYFEHSIGITANDSNPENVVFKIDKVGAKYLESQPIHKTQKLIKEGNSRNTYEIQVILSEELRRLILSYGPQIEIIKPKSLRKEILTAIHEMQENYG